MGALLEFPQLVDPQVVETTRFNPEGILPHLSESRSTHFLDYLSEVSHVPQRLSFLLELPILHVVGHVIYGLQYDLSPPIVREIFHLIVQKPVHEVSHISCSPQTWVHHWILRYHLEGDVTNGEGSLWSSSVSTL